MGLLLCMCEILFGKDGELNIEKERGRETKKVNRKVNK
jgi:hypothetical protein